MKSIFWLSAFLFSLVFLAAAYYVTSPSVRIAIDARAPWVADYLRPYVRGSQEIVQVPSPARPQVEVPEPTPAPAVPVSSLPPAAPVAVAVPTPEVFDLKKLAANRAGWPAKVAIKKDTDFPAVVNGKVVGSLIAPAGTEVGLVTISGGKLGVEYQGGGAWLFVEETDLIARTQRK
jgi:hypothetical protein